MEGPRCYCGHVEAEHDETHDYIKGSCTGRVIVVDRDIEMGDETRESVCACTSFIRKDD